MKGIIVFYVNLPEDQDAEETFKIIRSQNSELIEKLKGDNDYEFMLVPTSNEACRIEKIDMAMPFPRYVAPHVDVVENDKIIQSMRKAAEEDE